jgi:hypothetical protein
MRLTRKTHPLLLALLVSAPMAAGCGGTAAPATHNDASVATGGAGAIGGTTSTAGKTGAGGQPATGGSASGLPVGGTTTSSGGVAAGGTSATGGAGGRDAGLPDVNTQTGGTTATGGTSRSGGTLATGGTIATGGTTSGGGSTRTGGTTATGGIGRTGGTTAAGASAATGGSTAAGGSVTSGGNTPDGGVATTGWATIHNDFFWYDQDGNLINVRSGALRKFGDLYYWYGSPAARNQTCYTSTDLVHWTYKGVLFASPVEANRMDMLYNSTKQQYVMFLKYDGDSAYLGIATSPTPDGQFTFLSQTLVDGYTIGDMSMFEDDDGQAYLAYVWWETGPNREHGIYRMSPDYLTLAERVYLWNIPSREAPHIFKRNGIYYYGTSRTASINPTATEYYTATNLAGPWSAATTLNTPGSTDSWATQCDFVFPFQGTQGTVYMYDGDRWLPTGSSQGDYVWLPMEFDATGVPTMSYYQDWDLNVTTGTWRTFDSSRNLALGKTATASSESGTNVAAGVTTATTYQNYTNYRWESAASDPQWIMLDLGAAMEIDRVILKWYTDYGKAFKIQVSTDSTTWTDVYGTTVGASYSVTDVTFSATTARYVRMYGTQRGNQNGYSLFAFMVLNDP